jgi:hypothetical protein
MAPIHKLGPTVLKRDTLVRSRMVMETELDASASTCTVPRSVAIHKVPNVASHFLATSSMLHAKRSKSHLNRSLSQPAQLLRIVLSHLSPSTSPLRI